MTLMRTVKRAWCKHVHRLILWGGGGVYQCATCGEEWAVPWAAFPALREMHLMELPSVGVMREKPQRPGTVETIAVAKVSAGQALVDLLWHRRRYRVTVIFEVEVTDLGAGQNETN